MAPTVLGRPAGGRVRRSNLLGMGERPRGSAGGLSAQKPWPDTSSAKGLHSKRIACSDVYSAAVLPYFDRNIFVNFHNGRGSSFVVWSDNYLQLHSSLDANALSRAIRRAGLRRQVPPFCLLPWQDPTFELPLSSEYRCVGYFPGNQFWKTGAYERDDYVCYVRRDIPAAEHDPGVIGGPTVRFASKELEILDHR